MSKLKMVRAIRTGFWDGHRRRAGAVFAVAANAKERWFVDAGPAPDDAQLPIQLTHAQAPAPKTFIGAMAELSSGKARENAQPETLAGAAPEVDDGALDLT